MVQNQKSGDHFHTDSPREPLVPPRQSVTPADGVGGSFSHRIFLVTERTELNMTFDPMRRSVQGGCGSQK